MSRWLIRFFILLFLFFHLALSFHYHNHHFVQPTCALCQFILSSSNFTPENHHEVLFHLNEIGYATIEDRVIHPYLHKNLCLARSPPA
jgi:hypothetical protein